MEISGQNQPCASNAGAENARSTSRTRRACDKCSQSRAKCHGGCPCRRCKEYGYSCHYNRQVNKRGRQPRSSHRVDGQIPQQSARQSRGQSVKPTVGTLSNSQSALSSCSSAVSQRPWTHDGTRQQSPCEAVSSSARQATIISTPTPPELDILQPPPVPIDRISVAPQAGSLAVARDGRGGHSSADYGIELSELDDHHSYPVSIPASTGQDTTASSTTTATTDTDCLGPGDLQQEPTDAGCYTFLGPVLPYIRNIISESVASELLDVFLTDPGGSLFRGSSPYILTRVFRKKSMIDPKSPRRTSPALLAAILWCVAQTADVMVLHVPGTRTRVVNGLYEVATFLVSQRDPDRWRRTHDGLRAENDRILLKDTTLNPSPDTPPANEPSEDIDDVLTYILLTIAISGGDFKSDCYKWWSKAVRLAITLRLNREDEQCSTAVSPCTNPVCSCHKSPEAVSTFGLERQEERRRVFWLLYSLDRHLSLSFNTVLSIPDSYCEVYVPLPEQVWENLDTIAPNEMPLRKLGPPVLATGPSFFEFFLPLMVFLGDIIEVHHRRRHPRLGVEEDSIPLEAIRNRLADYEQSLNAVIRSPSGTMVRTPSPTHQCSTTGIPVHSGPGRTTTDSAGDLSREPLVMAYSTHIMHVLHVLLHGKWDAIAMLENDDDWITSNQFTECTAHAIAASQSLSTILAIDPELAFMSYLFGIYLLQGSFIFLLFADRLPQLGPNESVQQACENIVRAHEVCVVTLSTEFQRNFRKIMRSILYSVQRPGPVDWEAHRATRRALSLFRWTRGARGLAL